MLLRRRLVGLFLSVLVSFFGYIDHTTLGCRSEILRLYGERPLDQPTAQLRGVKIVFPALVID